MLKNKYILFIYFILYLNNKKELENQIINNIGTYN